MTISVTVINRYAKQCIEISETLKRTSHTNECIPFYFEEMKPFIAYIIKMGLTQKSTFTLYWSTLPSIATPWFGQILSRNHFKLVFKFFHLGGQ